MPGKYHAVAAHLAEGRFQEVLLAMLKVRREGGGGQGAAFHGTVREGIVTSRLNYEMALTALDSSPLEVKRTHRETLITEMYGASPREPVAAVREERSA